MSLAVTMSALLSIFLIKKINKYITLAILTRHEVLLKETFFTLDYGKVGWDNYHSLRG